MLSLAIALLLGALVFRLARGSGWHWAAALGVGLIPLHYTFLLDIIGEVVSVLCAGAMPKATAT